VPGNGRHPQTQADVAPQALQADALNRAARPEIAAFAQVVERLAA